MTLKKTKNARKPGLGSARVITHPREIEQPALFSLSGGGKTLQAKFEAFHGAHPDVYAEFKKIAYQLLALGVRHYGAGAIFEVMRFNRTVSGRDIGEPFKLNNVYRSRYARLLIDEDPTFAGFFETRALKTA